MNPKDLEYAIDTLRREEELLLEFKRYLRRSRDIEMAVALDHMAREISGVRIMLESERADQKGTS